MVVSAIAQRLRWMPPFMLLVAWDNGTTEGRKLSKRKCQVDKFGAMIMFLTTWDDAKSEQNRKILLDPLLEEAKKIRRLADR
jgi:hypothetical protein